MTANAICTLAGSKANEAVIEPVNGALKLAAELATELAPALALKAAAKCSGSVLNGETDTGAWVAGIGKRLDSAAMLHHVAELNNGKIHCNDQAADEPAEDDDHERLAQARKHTYLFVYLTITK
jgi:hypothetical protein